MSGHIVCPLVEHSQQTSCSESPVIFIAIGACLPAVRQALNAADAILAARGKGMNEMEYTNLYHRVGAAAQYGLRNPHVSPHIYNKPLLSAATLWGSTLASCLTHLKPRLLDDFAETARDLLREGHKLYLVIHRPSFCLSTIYQSLSTETQATLNELFPKSHVITASDTSPSPAIGRDTTIYQGLNTKFASPVSLTTALAIEATTLGTHWAHTSGIRTVAFTADECGQACIDTFRDVGAKATFTDWHALNPKLLKAILYSPQTPPPSVH